MDRHQSKKNSFKRAQCIKVTFKVILLIYHLLDIQNVQATDMRYNKDKTRIRIQIVRQYVATHSLLWSQPSTALRVALADLKRLKKVKQVQAQGLWFTRIFIVLLEQVAAANVATTFVGAERTKSSVHLGLESFTTLLRKLNGQKSSLTNLDPGLGRDNSK